MHQRSFRPWSLPRRAFVRSVLAGAASTACAQALPGPHAYAKPQSLRFGQPFAFSFDALIERARGQAASPYKEPYRPAPELVSKIDYDAHGKIKWKSEAALFADQSAGYPVTFFHLGQLFQKSVKMHELRAGQAREILYSPDYFNMPADSIARKLPKDSGFAGFRLQESRARSDWKTQDWCAFLGASYLRAIGALNQYGLSARGIAINTTSTTPEEFPDFVEFFIEPAASEREPVLIHALLDGPSLSGAYRFAVQRTTGVLMDVDCALFLRKDVAQLGIAPLTSMFWFAEYDRGFRIDWRPEVHDSDGLAIWNGAGERIWRPLNAPTRVVTSSFVDKRPKGFGLLQRDRAYDHYLDGVNYDRRPSLWVEPLGDWGEGAVQLVEIPTDDEIHDNIVAFWVAKTPAKAGAALRYRYKLHWLADEPYPATNVARVAATRIGRGGEPGKARPKGVTKFVLEFEGKPIDALPTSDKLSADISASRGKVSYVFVEPVGNTKRWRAQFDITADGNDPIELRVFLKKGSTALTETWLYQLEPRSPVG
jgi:periplasmic glucans biosynthesis protein